MTQPRNPFEHHHDHGDHDHDLEVAEQLDPAQQSLADALRVSFGFLKVAMVILVVFYLFSGFFNVPSGEVAVRLRFGEIVGEGADRVIQPGNLHPALPFPIEQVIHVSGAPRHISLDKEFWFKPNPQAGGPAGPNGAAPPEGKMGPLNPEEDGSLLTGDANIIHVKWAVTYAIDKARAIDYITNVENDEEAERLVRGAIGEAVVTAVSTRLADDIKKRKPIKDEVVRHAQQVLDKLNSGLLITDLTQEREVFPMSVSDAYEAVTRAESEKAKLIEDAQQERSRILGEAAGEASRPLIDLIAEYDLAMVAKDDAAMKVLDTRLDWIFRKLEAPKWLTRSAKLTPEAKAELWATFVESREAKQAADPTAASAAEERYKAALEKHKVPRELEALAQVSGSAAESINEANSYRSTFVANVEREATIFQNWFNVYKGDPKMKQIVYTRLEQLAKADILTGDVETFYLPPNQLELWFSRDAALRKQREQRRLIDEQNQRRLEAERQKNMPRPSPPPPPGP